MEADRQESSQPTDLGDEPVSITQLRPAADSGSSPVDAPGRPVEPATVPDPLIVAAVPRPAAAPPPPPPFQATRPPAAPALYRVTLPPGRQPRSPTMSPAIPQQTPPALPALQAAPAPAPVAPRTGGGPTAFGVAFGLAALVAVGGMAFAVGRWSAEEPNLSRSAFTGGGESAPGRQEQPDGFGGGQRGQDGFGGQAQGGQGAPDGFGGQAQGGQGAPDGIPAALGSDIDQQAPDPDQDSDQNQVQAQEPGQGDHEAGGFRDRGQGFPDGFGVRGIQGLVTGIGDIGITVQSGPGELLQFVIGDDTSFVREMSAEPTSLAAGDSVRVQFPFPQFDDGEVAEPAPGSDIATLVTMLRPGAELNEGFGRERGQDRQGQEDSLRPGGRQGFGGVGGRFGVQGTVVSFADSTLTLGLANGESQTIATDTATMFVREEEMDPTTLQVGDVVRIQVARGGFDGNVQGARPEGPRAASQVTVVPATQ